MSRIVTFFLSFFFVLVLSFKVPNNLVENRYTSRDVKNDSLIELWFSDTTLKNSVIAFSCYNISKQEMIYERNQYLRLVPASILKILTTVTAYEVLSESYTFKTEVYINGKISQGELQGDLIIKGSGDPTIGSEFFEPEKDNVLFFKQLLNELKKLNITKINGNLVADVSLLGYMMQPPGYLWEDLGNYYGAGSSALNFKENKKKLVFSAGREVGAPATLVNNPSKKDGVKYINLVTTGEANSGDKVCIYGTALQKTRILTGTVPLGAKEFAVYEADENPSERLINECFDFLNGNSILINGKAQVTFEPYQLTQNSKLIFTYKSCNLQKIISYINQRSHNVAAESLFRTIGQKMVNSSDYEATAKAITDYWIAKQFPANEIFIHDGSGLSRKNQMTTNFMLKLLIYASNQQYFKLFLSSLAKPGIDGTLKNRFTDSKYKDKIFAKTGSLLGVNSLAGYVINEAGEMCAFVFISNGNVLNAKEMNKKIDNLITIIAQRK